MEPNGTRNASSLQRQLANLKLISRLLGHELHSQGSAKTVTLTREEVVEIQTTIDLFIEEVGRGNSAYSGSGMGTTPATAETRMVPGRN